MTRLLPFWKLLLPSPSSLLKFPIIIIDSRFCSKLPIDTFKCSSMFKFANNCRILICLSWWVIQDALRRILNNHWTIEVEQNILICQTLTITINNCFIIPSPSLFFLMNMFGKRSDLPISRNSDREKEKSVLSFTHEQNVIQLPSGPISTQSSSAYVEEKKIKSAFQTRKHWGRECAWTNSGKHLWFVDSSSRYDSTLV